MMYSVLLSIFSMCIDGHFAKVSQQIRQKGTGHQDEVGRALHLTCVWIGSLGRTETMPAENCH